MLSRIAGVLTLFVCLSLITPVHGQIPGIFKGKDKGKELKEAKEPQKSDKAPEYSEKDKKKLEEIAQRQEVKEQIENEWENIRRADMKYAYVINSFTGFRESVSNQQAADFLAEYGKLYDNPILQNYANSVGQRLVPKDSPNLYAFRILLDPVPRAEALTTGTTYVSTGLISLLDNEAQLAYVLGHEISHLERNHHYKELRQTILEQKLWEEKQKDAEKKQAWIGLAGVLGGAAVGALANGSTGAAYGTLIGGAAGLIAGNLLYRNQFKQTNWSVVNEDEADEAGLRLVLAQKYDAREVPKTYARLDNLVAKDARIGLGFMGSPKRVKARISHIKILLAGILKPELDRVVQEGAVGSTPNFSLLMAALKRDNGVAALEYDLFPMAKDNLEDALNIRSNDPRAHYYLGKVLALTGRDAAEKQQAVNHFLKAIQYDVDRGSYPEPHLQKALFLIDQNSPANQEEIQSELKTYVTLYQREHAGALPSNMHIIYDYFLLSGENRFYVPPVMNISTRNIQPVSVQTTTSAPAASISAPAEPIRKPVESKTTKKN